MPTPNHNVVSKELAPYLGGEGFKSASALLRCVRKAMEDIKKEKPCLAELGITEISFLKKQNDEEQNNAIILKVYFDANAAPATTPE